MPSALHQARSASNRIGCGALPVPGMSKPASPASGPRATPKRSSTKPQKSVFPLEVVVIEPVGSATASYETARPAALPTSLPSGSTSCAWITL